MKSIDLHGPAASPSSTTAAALRAQLTEVERVEREAEAKRAELAKRQAKHVSLAEAAAAEYIAAADVLLLSPMTTPRDWLQLGVDLYAARDRLQRGCETAADGAPTPSLVTHVGYVAVLNHPTTQLERLLGVMWERPLPLPLPLPQTPFTRQTGRE